MKKIEIIDKTTSENLSLAYSDYGKGQPIVLLSGWPLSREMWEYQLESLVEAGYRVIKYDRRGFGASSKPWGGYDYDTLTNDLNEIIIQLALQDVILIGFSMGGGEVVRYVSQYGPDNIAGIVLISSIIPYMKKTADNPEGVDAVVFEDMIKAIQNDRIGFLDEFGKKFFGVDEVDTPVSTPLLNYYLQMGSEASQRSTVECAKSFSSTDFRSDVEKITVPVLIIHGDADSTVPIDASSNRTARLLPTAEYKIYKGAPHGLFYTHREKLNTDLLSFIKNNATKAETKVPEKEVAF
ncbi:MAG: alpha/beta hydrolase [Chitinophagaceae bacterium]|nr:alpha/beta hydrolase [Chitinophagaceae bacterium]